VLEREPRRILRAVDSRQLLREPGETLALWRIGSANRPSRRLIVGLYAPTEGACTSAAGACR